MKRLLAFGLGLVALAAVAMPAAAASPAAVPGVLVSGAVYPQHFAVEPSVIQRGANGDTRLIELRWTSWTSTRAVGTGREMLYFVVNGSLAYSEEHPLLRSADVVLENPEIAPNGRWEFSKAVVYPWSGSR